MPLPTKQPNTPKKDESLENSLPSLPEEVPILKPIVPQVPRKKQVRKTDNRKVEELSSNTDSEWVTDPRTKVKYKRLPKTEIDAEGRPVSHIGDQINGLFDMEETAKMFLGHLQVAPDKKELQDLRKEKASLERKQKEELIRMHKGEE